MESKTGQGAKDIDFEISYPRGYCRAIVPM